MSRKSYQLINPVIEGTFNDVVDSAKSPITAAEKIWGRLTAHISGHVPKFMFSMKSVDDNSLYHFQVKEKISDGSYTIKELKGLNVEPKEIDAYHAQIDSVQENNMKGGDRKRYKNYDVSKDDSDTSDSSSSDDVFSGVEFNATTTSPIALFHYTTKFYYQHDGKVFKHESTQNPDPIILKPVPAVAIPVMPISNYITTQLNFTSIPIFKAPLLPRVCIWN